MTTNTTTLPVLRPNRRFWALIAAIVVATAALVIWTVTQQQTIDDGVTAPQAMTHPSIRQVERADAAFAALEQLDRSDVRRFDNQAAALAPVKPNARQLQRLEQTEVQRFRNRLPSPEYRHPGVQP